MQVSCVTCGTISDDGHGTYPINQAWCMQCQQPRSFLPVFNESLRDSCNRIEFSEFLRLLDDADTTAITQKLIVDTLQGRCTKDSKGQWVCILDEHVMDMPWVYSLINAHPVWIGNLYNIYMQDIH
jgi:hypothetical protein